MASAKSFLVVVAIVGAGILWFVHPAQTNAPTPNDSNTTSTPAPTARPPGPSPAASQSATAAIDPHADDLFQEENRPKSAALAAYEAQIKPLNWKLALAKMAFECNLRSSDWFDGIAAAYDEKRREQPLTDTIASLSNSEVQRATAYDKLSVEGALRWYFDGGHLTKAGCDDFRKVVAARPEAAWQF